MGTTPTYLLPYPELSEPDDVPADVKQLADRLEVILPTFEQVVRKGAPSGYASLDATGKVPAAQLPAVSSGVATIVRKVTEKDVVNTVTKTDLFNGELTIPANALTPTGIATLLASGDYLNDTGSNKNLALALQLGASPLWGHNATILNSSARRTWRLSGELWSISATQQRFSGAFFLGVDGAPAATVGQGPFFRADGTWYIAIPLSVVVTTTMTAPQNLSFSVTHASASASLSMRVEHARITAT